MKQQGRLEKAICTNYKKRHRKNLNAGEIERILTACNQPYKMHKDVASQFGVTVRLVDGLVRESKRKPEKLEELRDREQLNT